MGKRKHEEQELPVSDEIDFLEAFAIPLPVVKLRAIRQFASVVPRQSQSGGVFEITDPTLSMRVSWDGHVSSSICRLIWRRRSSVRAEPNSVLISHLANLDVNGQPLEKRELQCLLSLSRSEVTRRRLR